MADNDVLQSAAPATLPAGLGIGFRRCTYSGDASQAIAPVGLGAFAGADDAKTFFDLGACSNAHLVAAATTNATNVKASPGLLVAVRVFNLALYPVYVKLHNNAGVPVAGVGVVKTIGVQAGQARDVLIPGGHYFATGIAFTIVKGITDGDATAVALSDCVVDVEYN
jgi:hypothetical protein